VRRISEWIAATPFVLCEPTIARLPCGPFSAAFLDQAHPRDAALVAGKAASYVVEKAW